jgi:short-subunit dehydrogenase
LPEEAFTTIPYPVDWLDTGESERVLHYQRHTLSDYMLDVRRKLGIGRQVIRLFRPIVKRIVLGQSPVLRERAKLRLAVLRGKTAVVIGGSGGIGAATAVELARAGIKVALVGRNEDRLEEVASRLRADGAECLTIAADLSEESECLRVFERVREAFGPADILVNSAGLGWYGYGAEMPWALAREMIQVNIAAVVRMTLLFLKDMRERNSGHVINVGSVIGALPTQGAALYSATKSFLDSLTSALYRELRGTQVHVSVVRPGPVATSFFQRSSDQPAALPLPGKRFAVSPEAVARQIMGVIRRPRRIVYVPALLAVVPWLEPSLGWLIDLLGPVLLNWQMRRL